MVRRLLVLVAATGLVLALAAAALGATVTVRVEGKTQSIFGSAPVQIEATNALQALDAASTLGEFYYQLTHLSFGDYVSQIGKYPAAASSGWVFKVNGVSPPVGADQVVLNDGDTVLWYYATFGDTGGPPTLDLKAAGGNCYTLASARRRRQAGRAHRRLAPRRRPPRQGELQRARLCRSSHGCRARVRGRGGSVERREVKALRRISALLLAGLALAGCGGAERSDGTATLWVTRDRGATVLLDTRVPAGQTLLRALRSKTDVGTRYGGRFIQSIDGLNGSLARQHDWFWFVNGYAGGSSAAEYRLHDGDVAWWDYRGWAVTRKRSWSSPARFPSRSCTASAARDVPLRCAMHEDRRARRSAWPTASARWMWRRSAIRCPRPTISSS